MGKFCIFCDSEEKSKEHIFPSCFGGRIENSKIYCRMHNSYLGKYVGVLNQQIGGINNLFAVQPDRGEAKAFDVVDSVASVKYYRNIDGQLYIKPDIESIDTEDLKEGIPQTLVVSKLEDAEKVAKELSKEIGMKVSINPNYQVTKKLFDAPVEMQITFGGEDFFKATIYILITFLAHYEKSFLLNFDIQKISKILLDDGDIDVNNIISLGPHPSFLKKQDELAHTVAFIAREGGLYGVMSYFNSVCYTVKLFDFDVNSESDSFQNFAVYIYPLCDDVNPNNGMQKEFLFDDIDLIFRPELHKDMIQQILNGYIQEMFGNIKEQLRNKEKKEETELLREIKLLTQKEEVLSFLQDHRQRIYNIIHSICNNAGELEPALLVSIQYIKLLLSNKDISEDLPSLFNFNLFLDQCIDRLAMYFTSSSSNDDGDFLVIVGREVFLLAWDNLRELKNLNAIDY